LPQNLFASGVRLWLVYCFLNKKSELLLGFFQIAVVKPNFWMKNVNLLNFQPSSFARPSPNIPHFL